MRHLLVAALCAAWVDGRASWREISANGTWPQSRHSHSAILDADGRMVLFGGNAFDPTNDLFTFDVSRAEWTRRKPAVGAAPSKRYGHSTALLRDGRILVFGGFNGTFLNDVHLLTLGETDADSQWELLSTSGDPSGRDGHSTVIAPDGLTLLLFGGYDGEQQLSDVHALDIRTGVWTLLDPLAGVAPPARCLHVAQPCTAGMLVHGGFVEEGDEDARFGDLWQLKLLGRAADGTGAPTDGGESAAPSVEWVELQAEAIASHPACSPPPPPCGTPHVAHTPPISQRMHFSTHVFLMYSSVFVPF